MWNNRIEFLLVSFFCICSLAFTGCQTKKQSDRYVVVLSMDGFALIIRHVLILRRWILWRMWGFAPRFARVIPA